MDSKAKGRSPRKGQDKAADPRFATIRTSAIYRLPSKQQNRVALDPRFSGALDEERFVSQAKVDRYGRRLQNKAQRKALDRLYRSDHPSEVADEHASSSRGDNLGVDDRVEPDLLGTDDDTAVRDKLARVGKPYDPARDGGFSSSSSEEEDSSDDGNETGDEEALEALDIHDAKDDGIPEGEVSSRLAIVNLDWDNIQATDLVAVCSSFAPSGGRILRATIYPSEFGKERMERENVEGPPREIFANKAGNPTRQADSDESEDEDIKRELVKEDKSEDFDSVKLRNYQLERLRYFYAILECSSAECAKTIYDSIDGTEYQSSANFFDLRFVPDGMDFSQDTPRDVCDQLPERYRPNEFVTDALQHSKVKLSWDADDPRRAEAQKRAFSANKADDEEDDLQAFLASSSSSEDENEGQVQDKGDACDSGTKRVVERGRLRALLGLSEEASKSREKGASVVGDMEVTFTSGLLGPADTKDRSKDPEAEETTIEKYARKEKERKALRKQASKTGTAAPIEQGGTKETNAEEDLGFDDPFFTAPAGRDVKSSKSRKKHWREAENSESAEAAAEAAGQRAELELLMTDGPEGIGRTAHFDKRELKAQAKLASKGKRKGKRALQGSLDQSTVEDGFKMDVSDPRFAAIYDKSELAVDPSHPRFDKTQGMVAVLAESRRKRQRTAEEY